MNKAIIASLIASLAFPALALSETNVNISIGAPPVAVLAPPRVVFQTPPLFLAPPKLGFYIGVDMPYDLVFISGSYYLLQGNSWYRSGHYDGPWASVRHDRLPPAIRGYNVDRIRQHREQEYRAYQQERDHYRGRHYRPDKEFKKERKAQKRYEKEERKRDKEERKYEKREEHQDHGKHRGHDE